MATADEILAESGISDDVWFEVDLNSRVISVPKVVTNLGVKSDANVKKVKFKLPRFYYGSDLSEFKIGVDYTNARGEPDRYEPVDVTTDESTISFTWIVGRHAAVYNGKVTFSVCLKKTEGSEVIQELHTTNATLNILDGTETCETVIVDNLDLLEQWREELFTNKAKTIPMYTEIQKTEGNKICIINHNIPKDDLILRVFFCSSKRGRKQYLWSPLDGVTESQVEGLHYGYKNLVGEEFLIHGTDGGVVHTGVFYPSVPDWMPNGGLLQTKFSEYTDKKEIIISEWMLPMLKPRYSYTENAADWTKLELYGRQRARGAIPIKFMAERNGTLYPCINTLYIGIRRYSLGKESIIDTKKSEYPDNVEFSIRNSFYCSIR